jgi:hypothetical protein
MYDIEPFVYRWFDDPIKYGGNDDGYRVNCPFCNDRYGTYDEDRKLHISVIKQVVHCFRCDYSANWVRFIMEVAHINYVQALGELYVVPNVKNYQNIDEVFDVRPSVNFSNIVKLPEDFIGLWESSTALLHERAKRYMKSRGFRKNVWVKYGIGTSEKIGWRVIIPIEENYWQGRALSKSIEPKYKNPPTESRHYVFNSQALELYEEVVICEGVFSAMSIGDNVVGLLRKHATQEQITRLIDVNVKKYIVTIEPGAFPSMSKLADKLIRGGKDVDIWNYVDGDPNEYSTPPEKLRYDLHTKLKMLF